MSDSEPEIVFISEDEEDEKDSTWTVTFSERVENHVGMQIVGDMADTGFSIQDLIEFQTICKAQGKYKCEIVDIEESLPEDLRNDFTKAQLLIVRKGMQMLMGQDYNNLVKETKMSKNIVDKKAWMRGRVVNKLARYNLCYGDEDQNPDYESKKGTIVAFNQVPYLNKIRDRLYSLFGEKCKDLLAELNYYYDIKKCGIGFHGDSERRRVIGLRFGSSMNLQYQWFQEGKNIGDRVEVNLNEGDFYIMSEKAVGTDWKKRKIPTLRHAAGAKKYTDIK